MNTHSTNHKAPRVPPVAARSAPDWKPHPCGLTREELRQLIIEQLG
ncbi:MAG: hypothetical protein AB1592_15530 [Pseudomonadota bacterium]